MISCCYRVRQTNEGRRRSGHGRMDGVYPSDWPSIAARVGRGRTARRQRGWSDTVGGGLGAGGLGLGRANRTQVTSARCDVRFDPISDEWIQPSISRWMPSGRARARPGGQAGGGQRRHARPRVRLYISWPPPSKRREERLPFLATSTVKD